MTLKPLILAAALIAPMAAHAELPANTRYVTENQNGGTIALYDDARCYSGMAMYTESPMQGIYNRGCVTSVDKDAMHVHWDIGRDSDFDYSGWVAVGSKAAKSSM